MEYKESVVTDLANFIVLNIHKVKVRDVAIRSGFSYRTIQKMFIFYLNQNISDYISGMKIQMAANDLIYSPDSIESVAIRYGYSSVQSFTHVFTKKYKISPRVFRDINHRVYVQSL